MKRLALLIILTVAACRTVSVASSNPYRGHADATKAGAKLFDEHCAQCHGAQAQGRNAPSLRTPSVAGRSDAALYHFITNGDLRHGMPSWSRLTEQRRWQIVAYLRSMSND